VAPRLAARKGFLLFCRPFRPKITEKQQQFFNSSEKFTLVHEGIRVQGYRWGKGPKKVVFLHGWQSHTYRWKAYVEALSKEDYTVYSLDAPGHGLSEGDFLSVPLYSALIEQFIHDLGGVHAVVGHSLGSFSLLYTFHRLPLLPVSRVVLTAPPGEADDFVAVFREALGLTNRTLNLIADEFVRRYGVTPEYYSSQRFAQSLNVKGLVIHDEGDKEAPYHYSPALIRVWERAKLITTKGLGHNLKSANVVREVTDFVGERVGEPARMTSV
jgi:pimeloyl-ACP methyl ester carboxylesterase